jgi:hypothetical protein
MWNDRPTEATLGQIFGKTVEFPRRSRTYGHDYSYGGQLQRAAPLSSAPALISSVVQTMQKDAELSAHAAALVNYYDAALGHYMGPHADDERELVPCAAGTFTYGWTHRPAPDTGTGTGAALYVCRPVNSTISSSPRPEGP